MMPDDDTSVSTEASTTQAPAAAPAKQSGGGIKSANEVIEKVLAAHPSDPDDDEEGEQPEKPEAKPADKKPRARRVENLEAKAVEKAAAAPEAEAPPDDAGVLAKAHYHLKHGDVAKFIDVVTGDFKFDGLADGVREALARKLGVSSAQWEKVRKFEAAGKRAIAAREQELGGIVDRLRAEYAPFHAARAAYEKGDYDTAFKSAFGEDAAEYQRKIIGQRVGKNPEVEKLRAELEAERAERRQREQAEQEARAEAEQTQAVHEYLDTLQGQCRESEDPAIRKFAERPAFIQRIYAIQRANYDARANTTMPLSQAAELARDEILNSIKQWSIEDVQTGAHPANAARASAPPAKPPAAKAPARALKQSQAAEANGAPVKLTSEQVREKYQRMMEAQPGD
ncbi:MAG TPA: hypothetical protein VER96_33810 [Polyangiaceae bacterium]|nr:hypothetical protein [Polyangiaceae bacterium]